MSNRNNRNDHNDDDDYEDIVCERCRRGDYEALLLICEECKRGYHTYCLGLNNVPRGDWYCNYCVNGTASSTERLPSSTQAQRMKLQGQHTREYAKVYIRVSSRGQDNPVSGNVGVDTQNTAILNFCVANNLHIKSTATEVGSAYTCNTPVLHKLVKRIEKNVPIIVYDASRFSRCVDNARRMIDIVHSRGSYVWSVLENKKSCDDKDGFLRLVDMAEQQSKVSGQRISDAYKRIRAQGGYIGRRPFGYDKIRVNGVTKLRRNKREQEGLRKMMTSSWWKNRGPRDVEIRLKKKYGYYPWSIKSIDRIANGYQFREYDQYLVEDEINVDDMLTEIKKISKGECVEDTEEDEMEEVYDEYDWEALEEKMERKRRSFPMANPDEEAIIGIRYDSTKRIYEIGVTNKGKEYWLHAAHLYEDAPENVKNYLLGSGHEYARNVWEYLNEIYN